LQEGRDARGGRGPAPQGVRLGLDVFPASARREHLARVHPPLPAPLHLRRGDGCIPQTTRTSDDRRGSTRRPNAVAELAELAVRRPQPDPREPDAGERTPRRPARGPPPPPPPTAAPSSLEGGTEASTTIGIASHGRSLGNGVSSVRDAGATRRAMVVCSSLSSGQPSSRSSTALDVARTEVESCTASTSSFASARSPSNRSVRRAGGSGRTFSATCTITPMVPSDPATSLWRSYPVTFFTVRAPLRTSRPSPVTISASRTVSRSAPNLNRRGLDAPLAITPPTVASFGASLGHSWPPSARSRSGSRPLWAAPGQHPLEPAAPHAGLAHRDHLGRLVGPQPVELGGPQLGVDLGGV